VSEKLYFNDVKANEVKITPQEEILRFMFCGKKIETMPNLTVSSGKSSHRGKFCMLCRPAIIITTLLSLAGPTRAQGKVA
jgi:hypothetical protein